MPSAPSAVLSSATMSSLSRSGAAPSPSVNARWAEARVALTPNGAAVRAVATADLDLVGVALRAAHRDADTVLRGLQRHP
jgi:hypothetical protein